MPLELSADQQASDLEILSLQPSSETGTAKSLVDTTGVLNSEESKFFGTMFISGIKYDAGGTRQRASYSKVNFSDKTQPVERDGKRIGYRAIDVGRVSLDGADMLKVEKILHLPNVPPLSKRDTAVGPQYILGNRNGLSFRHNSRFEWRVVGNGPIRPFNLSAMTPDELTITSPSASAVVFKNEDLRVQWQGKIGSFRLVVSALGNSGVEPLLMLNIKGADHVVTIPAKVLALLPTDSFRTYVFSFISSNTSRVLVDQFPDEILVVAASVHNLVLTVE
jgi:hypothetical protein